MICTFSPAAFAEHQVTEVPQQPDAPRPHHQVTASPPQEEEATKHQRTVPGQTRIRTRQRTIDLSDLPPDTLKSKITPISFAYDKKKGVSFTFKRPLEEM